MKKIQFYPAPENAGPPPVPAKTLIPQWYKDISLYNVSNSPKDLTLINTGKGTDSSSISVKLCSPTFDSFIMGYHFVLGEDIYVSVNEDTGVPSISWESNNFPISRAPIVEIPIPPGYHPVGFLYRMMYGVKTPPGTSVIVTHPFNRWDLPFVVPSAVVDSDKKFAPIDLRIFFKIGFEGIIKQGTPIFQVIPFTREDWEMEISPELTKDALWQHELRRTYLHSEYTKEYQAKKEYN